MGDRVGQGALESIAQLDAHLAVLHEHEQHRAVVLAGLSDAPLTSSRDGELFERRVFGKLRRDPDDDLIGGLALELLETGVERLGPIGGEHAREIGDVPRRLRRDLKGRESGAREREPEDESERRGALPRRFLRGQGQLPLPPSAFRLPTSFTWPARGRPGSRLVRSGN